MHQQEKEFSFYDLFIPLTNRKVIIFILLIGFGVYFNALFNNFIWDDITYLVFNSEVHSIDIARFFGENVYNYHGYYRPLQPLYFATLFTFFKQATFYYHLIQISMHIFGTILLYFFYKKFLRIPFAFLLSIIFLIHPIQVESVSYIAASGYEIFFVLGMGALLISLKSKISLLNGFWVSILLLLSLLIRETAILFFPVILFAQLLFNRKHFRLIFIFEIVAFLSYCFIRFGISQMFFEHNSLYPIGQLSLLGRIINIPAIIFYYFQTLVYPAKLAIDQLWIVTSLDIWNFYMPLFIDVLIVILYIFVGKWLYTKNKHDFTVYIFFLFWFLCGFAMLLQIVPLDMTVAERWMYFPIVGWLGMIGVALQHVRIHNPQIKRIIPYIILCVFLALAVRTIVRNANWINAEVLYLHDLKVSRNYDLENLAGTVLAAEEKYEEALPYLLSAQKQHWSDTNLYNLGSLYEKSKQYKKAKESYQQIVYNTHKIQVRDNVKLNAYVGYARMDLLLEKPEKNIEFLEKALDLYPNSGVFWSFMAINQYKLGNKSEALSAAKKADRFLNNESSNQLLDIVTNNKKLNIKL